MNFQDASLAQYVKHLTLGFGSGHDLRVLEFEPHIMLCADSMEPLGFLTHSLCPSSLSLSLSLSLSQNKLKKKKNELSIDESSNNELLW